MHYNFTADLAVGQDYENYLISRLGAYPNPYTDYERLKAFDFYTDNYFFEAKLDLDSARYHNICFETDLLISAADYYIYGFPTQDTIYSHVFSRIDIWRIIVINWKSRKWVGSPRVEVVCPRLEETLKNYGTPLSNLKL